MQPLMNPNFFDFFLWASYAFAVFKLLLKLGDLFFFLVAMRTGRHLVEDVLERGPFLRILLQTRMNQVLETF